MPDELLVGHARMNNLSRHRVGQRNVAANVEAQPRVRPLRGTRPARINHMELRAVANPLQHMMEENRMRLARVRAPKENNVRLVDFVRPPCRESDAEADPVSEAHERCQRAALRRARRGLAKTSVLES